MKLITDVKERSAGGFSGGKHHFVAFHVEFSNEERAIIQQRGLYDHFITAPSDMPPPTRGSDFLAMAARMVGIVLVPIGALMLFSTSFIPREAGHSFGAWVMLIVGGGLFTYGKIKDVRANKYDKSPDQKFTLKRLLSNPDFVSYAGSVQDAQSVEASVRADLASAAGFIRENSAVPSKASYEL